MRSVGSSAPACRSTGPDGAITLSGWSWMRTPTGPRLRSCSRTASAFRRPRSWFAWSTGRPTTRTRKRDPRSNREGRRVVAVEHGRELKPRPHIQVVYEADQHAGRDGVPWLGRDQVERAGTFDAAR